MRQEGKILIFLLFFEKKVKSCSIKKKLSFFAFILHIDMFFKPFGVIYTDSLKLTEQRMSIEQTILPVKFFRQVSRLNGR